MKAAILHAFCNFFFISADVIQSIGLLISSLFIFFLGSDKGARVEEWNDWHYFDPISTYIFSVIVIISTFPIVKNCYYIIMEATPSTDMAR
jgi:zinc transporter 2